MSSSTNRFDRLTNLTWSEPPAKKKKKKTERENTLTNWTFDLDQKVKIFKMDLSHSIFQVHSDFGTCFFIRNSEIVQTSNFQKVDFCANVDQMSKFLRWTYLTQFFMYIPILESVLSFETRKLYEWLDSKVVDFCVGVDLKSRFSSQTCFAQFFVTWKSSIWPTSLKY